MNVDWTGLHLLESWNDPVVVMAALSGAGTVDPDLFDPPAAA